MSFGSGTGSTHHGYGVRKSDLWVTHVKPNATPKKKKGGTKKLELVEFTF